MFGTNVRTRILDLCAVIDKPFDQSLIRTHRSAGYRIAVSLQPETVADRRTSSVAIAAR